MLCLVSLMLTVAVSALYVEFLYAEYLMTLDRGIVIITLTCRLKSSSAKYVRPRVGRDVLRYRKGCVLVLAP